MRIPIWSALTEKPSHSSSKGFQLHSSLQRFPTRLNKSRISVILVGWDNGLLNPINCKPQFSFIIHVYFMAPLQPISQVPLKEPLFVPLGFLIRCTGTEPRTVNRICVWSGREGSDETCHSMMLSRSIRDPRVIPITTNLPRLQKVSSFSQYSILLIRWI